MINFLSKFKFIFYITNIFLIILYLFPGSLLGCFFFNNCKIQPQLTPDFLVSTNHVYAFFVLSIVGLLTYKKTNNLNFLTMYLILLSIVLEIFHLIIPGRGFELSDIFGNLIGVIIAVIINFFSKKYENFNN